MPRERQRNDVSVRRNEPRILALGSGVQPRTRVGHPVLPRKRTQLRSGANLNTGDWQRCREILDEASADKTDGIASQPDWVLELRAHLAASQGHYREALQLVSGAIEASKLAPDAQAQFALHVHRARIAAEAGDFAAAAADSELAIRNAVPHLKHATVLDLAFVFHDLNRDAELLAMTSQRRIRTRVLRAAEAIAEHDYQLAASLLQQIGLRPDEAHARMLHGELLLQRGDTQKSADELASALKFWQSVGATAYAQHAAEQLAHAMPA